jgi:uncharacterized protein (TIGR02246 family)
VSDGADAQRQTEGLYRGLLDAWNEMSVAAFANLFASDGSAIGYDGTQMNGQTAIRSSLAAIFADHEPARYVGIVRDVRLLAKDVAVLQAVAGMVPRGGTDLNENLTVQSLVATRDGGRWKIALWHNTPAAFEGRPEARDALFAELRKTLPADR